MTPEDVIRRRNNAEAAERMRKRIEKDSLEERQFLECVASNPGISSKEAYGALGIKNYTKGGDIRDILEDRGFILVQRVRTLSLSGKGVVRANLSITPEGEEYLQQLQKKVGDPQTIS